MNYFSNILAASYLFYGKFKYETPYVSSICFTTSCELLFVMLINQVLKKYISIDLLFWLPHNKIYMLLLVIIWMIFGNILYSKDRVNKILERYNKKSKNEKIVWGIMAWVSLLLPLMIIPFLSTK